MKKPNIELQVTLEKELIFEQVGADAIFMMTMKEDGEGNAFMAGTETDLVHNLLAAIDGDDDVMKILSATFAYVMVKDQEELSPNLLKMKRNVMTAVIHEAKESGMLDKALKHAAEKMKGSN